MVAVLILRVAVIFYLLVKWEHLVGFPLFAGEIMRRERDGGVYRQGQEREKPVKNA